jgi:hypothetical protein
MSIIISKNGKNAKKVEQSHIVQEDYLQQYIYNNPDAVPVYDVDENVRLLILAREFPTLSGPIDALGIDQIGNIYLIETKLYKNPDKRTVVAQVLDYGASLWRSSNDFVDFTTDLEQHTNKQFGKGLNEAIRDHFGLQTEEVAPILDNMRLNLNSGTFKFVILMNKVHQQLKDLILFLNQNSQFDVLAVELEYYQHEDFEIMIPKVHGTDVKKPPIGPKPTSQKWSEVTFFEHAAKQLDDKMLQALRKLYEFSKVKADAMSWGTGATYGSFGPRFFMISKTKPPFTVTSLGHLSLNFGWLNETETAIVVRDKFKREIEARNLLSIPSDYAAHFPWYKPEKWHNKVDSFIEVVNSLISTSAQPAEKNG